MYYSDVDTETRKFTKKLVGFTGNLSLITTLYRVPQKSDITLAVGST